MHSAAKIFPNYLLVDAVVTLQQKTKLNKKKIVCIHIEMLARVWIYVCTYIYLYRHMYIHLYVYVNKYKCTNVSSLILSIPAPIKLSLDFQASHTFSVLLEIILYPKKCSQKASFLSSS